MANCYVLAILIRQIIANTVTLAIAWQRTSVVMLRVYSYIASFLVLRQYSMNNTVHLADKRFCIVQNAQRFYATDTSN